MLAFAHCQQRPDIADAAMSAVKSILPPHHRCQPRPLRTHPRPTTQKKSNTCYLSCIYVYFTNFLWLSSPPMCQTTNPPPSPSRYPEQQPLQWTHVTSSQRNQAPTHGHYPNSSRRPATTLRPTLNNPPRPATSRDMAAQPMHNTQPPGPWHVAPPQTPARPTPKLTPTCHADGSLQTTPNASYSTARWAT
jgi:hypothetical protein